MPRKDAGDRRAGKTRANTGKRYSDDFLGFVDIDLTDGDREALEAWFQPNAVDVWAFLEDAVNDGYKFSLVVDLEHSSSIATLTGKGAGCENLGYALSGRGPNPLEATVVLWYKHAVLAHHGSWVDQGSTPDQRQLPLWR